SEPRYHNFAVETMIKAFHPADFAPASETAEPSQQEETPAGEINIDLQGAAILFTGKLATMSRKEAQEKVRQANGSPASSVNAKLNYLVIGDEGSPLYGAGKKGSKQKKAESLIEDGAEIKIVSETAFLQMLAGEQREADDDATEAGCQRIWDMATGPGKVDAPTAKFALQYLRRRHPDICLKETERPVDPGAEIPADFLSFDRVRPLFSDARPTIRAFALELASWEFTRWAPPIESLVELCETIYGEVRAFVAKALLADDSPEHRRYRIDPAVLSIDAVYSFCESKDAATRMLGMQLIQSHPRLRDPSELFRLTESPDRKVRSFVIRALWSLYRNRAITADWKPHVPPQASVGASNKKKAEEVAARIGTGPPPRPDAPPASRDSLNFFLRRILFEIPPARLEKSRDENQMVVVRLKPLSARRAKLALIEVVRDLALEDAEFAEAIVPLLREFMASRGKSEFAACLTAVVRVKKTHPQLFSDNEEKQS
ncbi:MAG: BRCT domain-containing protein, partial [Planctomycetales bacterium]